MKNSKNITMNNKELTKATTTQECIAGKYTLDEAGQLLGITSRQICRLKIKYKEHGIKGLAHQARGRESNRKISEDVVKNIVEIINNKY
jgi:transposase